MQIQYFLTEIETYQDFCDCDFCGFLDFCLDLNQEITWFFTYLDWDIKWYLLKVGGLDLSRRDLDRDLDLDVQKISVSTVEKISTVFKS